MRDPFTRHSSPITMNHTRPWYRSRLYWLGTLGFIFLLWAWCISNFQATKATIAGCHVVLSNKGRLLWCHATTHNPATLISTPEGNYIFFLNPPWNLISSNVPPADRRWLPPPHLSWAPLTPDSSRHLILPYWLLTAGYTVTWLLALTAWQRHKTRLLKSTATLPP
jgi:hypothetical protein